MLRRTLGVAGGGKLGPCDLEGMLTSVRVVKRSTLEISVGEKAVELDVFRQVVSYVDAMLTFYTREGVPEKDEGIQGVYAKIDKWKKNFRGAGNSNKAMRGRREVTAACLDRIFMQLSSMSKSTLKAHKQLQQTLSGFVGMGGGKAGSDGEEEEEAGGVGGGGASKKAKVEGVA